MGHLPPSVVFTPNTSADDPEDEKQIYCVLPSCFAFALTFSVTKISPGEKHYGKRYSSFE